MSTPDSNPKHIDQKPFVENFVRLQHRVYGFIVMYIPNRNDADDVFQQTCIVLWEKWNQYDAKRDFVSWACGIAINVIRNYRRKNNHRLLLMSDEALDRLADVRTNLEDETLERRESLNACLDSLSDVDRNFVELTYSSNDSMRTIATLHNMTADAMYARLHRLRKKLFECVRFRMARSGVRLSNSKTQNLVVDKA
jgi:RNA polymerase sigma-70 factor, ECF subfamily